MGYWSDPPARARVYRELKSTGDYGDFFVVLPVGTWRVPYSSSAHVICGYLFDALDTPQKCDGLPVMATPVGPSTREIVWRKFEQRNTLT